MSTTVKNNVSLLLVYLKPQYHKVLLLAASLIIGIGLQVFNPQVLRFFIDTAVSSGATSTLIGAGILFIAAGIANQMVSIASSYLSTSVAWTAMNRLRSDLIEHCLGLDMSFHNAHTPGEMIERIDGDVNALSNFFSQLVINLVTSAMLLTVIIALFFIIDWREGIIMALFSLTAIVILMGIRRRAIPRWKSVRQMNGTFYGFLGERLAGLEDIRANGAVSYTLQRFYFLIREWFPLFRKAETAGAMMGIWGLFLFACGTVVALATGTYLWMHGLITIGTVYVIYAYTEQLTQPIQKIQAQLEDLQQVEACIRRIKELLSIKSTLHDGQERYLTQQAMAVDFDGVTFGYTPDRPVVSNLSFRIEPGRVLGILGRTGSGKTTITRLLFRLYDAQEGEIRLDGRLIETMRLEDVRGLVGMVTQDVELFHATVRDNVAFFNHAISDESIRYALEDVGLSIWYQALPEGLDTIISTSDQGLSAGEAQLLALARVLLMKPRLVILDEASSRLDSATEMLIEHAINRLFVGRTALVIAHRLKTIERADDILILEDGCVVEYGPREVLAADPHSRFSFMMRIGLRETRI